MATRSLISVNDNGKIKTVYCHWDGYPEGVGLTLVNCYPTKDLAMQVVSYGDISCLDDDMENSELYHRDRGEELKPARIVESRKAFLESAENSWCEYYYLFDNNKWLVYNFMTGNWDDLVDVIDEINKDDEQECETMKEVVESILNIGKTAIVTFTKKDGSQRVMRATKNSALIPATPVEEGKTKRVIADNPDVAKVYDLDIGEWRSFRYDSVISIIEA